MQIQRAPLGNMMSHIAYSRSCEMRNILAFRDLSEVWTTDNSAALLVVSFAICRSQEGHEPQRTNKAEVLGCCLL